MSDKIKNETPGTSIEGNGDNISVGAKIFAGLLLITFTCWVVVLIIGYWPDRLPEAGKSNRYSNTLFHVELLDSCDGKKRVETVSKPETVPADTSIKSKSSSDTSATATRDTSVGKKPVVENKIRKAEKSVARKWHCHECDCENTIQFNTLLLILVALCGFLGNMIHVATSFTTFIGAEKFKRSWILWYCVKPFTASALALAFYFVFRAGFLNYTSDAGLNLYGVLTMAMLTGLFTDIATQKLKEVFEVAFKPKDDRPNTLSGNGVKITGITPDKLVKPGENTITISGENFNREPLTIKINTEIIPYRIASEKSIIIKYTIPASQAEAAAFKLEIFNKDEKVIYTTSFTL
jgi:hypothetical protein